VATIEREHPQAIWSWRKSLSPFRQNGWIFLILAWAALMISFCIYEDVRVKE
jgi:hypothetical protein